MAETPDTKQTKDQESGNASADGQELSLDQLDSMILAEDPKFAEELSEVKSIPSDGSVDLDVVDLGESFPVEENPWKDVVGVRKVIVTILPFLPKLWDFKYRFFNHIHMFRSHSKEMLRNAGPQILQALKSGAQGVGTFIKGRLTTFKELTPSLKAVAVTLLLACGLTVFFVYRSLTHGVLPEDKEFLMASLEEWSAQTYKYDAETEMDSFYDSPRTIQNIMSLPKMVVNLRPSPSSGPNPMAAMEFFLEGMNPEAIVEVKDRESEIRDLFQRTIEESSYGELDSSEGKQLLTERLRQTLNVHLTKGKIRRVFIKELVIKP